MKSFKKAISIIATVAMLITTLTVTASLPVSAEDTAAQAPVYFTKFTADSFVGFGEYKVGENGYEYDASNTTDHHVQEGDVSYPIDGAVEIATKSTNSYGVRAIYKLDDSAKNYFSQLEDEAEAKYQENVNAAKENAEKLGQEFDANTIAKVYPSVKCRFFVNEAVTASDLDTDTFVTIAFVLKDGSLTDAIIGGGVKYATKDITVPIRKKAVVDGETVYSDVDLNEIEAVRLEVYHWTPSLKKVTFSGLTVSGDGELPLREQIEVGDEKTAVAVNWDRNYRCPYAPSPNEVLFSPIENPDGEDGNKSGFNKRGDAGWMKFKTTNASQRYQVAFGFDRDQFDYALALANKKDENGKLVGSGKFLTSLGLESCVDSKGEPVKAEVKVFFSTTNHGYIMMADEWQEPGTTVLYKLDVSQIDYSDVEMIVISVENTWYYDENGELVEYPESGKEVSVDLGNGETSNTIKYGTGVSSVDGIIPQVKVSPITVFDPTAPITTAKPTEPTTVEDPFGDGEDFDYCFFNFEEYSCMQGYNSQPSEIMYFNDSEDVGPLVPGSDDDLFYDAFYGGFKFKSLYSNPNGKKYQACWTTATAKATNDYMQEVETVISPEYTKAVKNRMAQALALANGPDGTGMLAYDVRVNSAKSGRYVLNDGKAELVSGTGKDCSVQVGVQIMCYDQIDNVANYDYQTIGDIQTYYLDVSELTVDMISQIRPSVQNYANIDPSTGNACGVYDIDVDFSAIYVAGEQFEDVKEYGDYLYTELSDGTVKIVSYYSEDKNVVIPSKIDGKAVTQIDDYAFAFCYSMESVTLPDSVTSIGEYAFIDCTSLKNITIPNSVTSIGDYAFGYCYCDEESFEIEKLPDFQINCYAGTAGEQYAIDNGFDYTLRDSDITYGDANGDGNVDMLDVLLIRKYIAKQPVTIDLTVSDVTCDDSVDMLDVLLIRKYIAKQPVTLGPQK